LFFSRVFCFATKAGLRLACQRHCRHFENLSFSASFFQLFFALFIASAFSSFPLIFVIFMEFLSLLIYIFHAPAHQRHHNLIAVPGKKLEKRNRVFRVVFPFFPQEDACILCSTWLA